MVILLAVLIASQLYNELNVAIYGTFIRYQLMAVFRTVPALLYTVTGYMLMLMAHKAPPILKRHNVTVFMLLVMMLLYLLAASHLRETIILRFFEMGENVLLGIFTGLAGSGMIILMARLLPETVGPLSKFGRESMHIMAFHYDPIPIKYVICTLYGKLVGPSLCIGSAICIFFISYFCSVCLFEPLCRWAKTRFDAIAQ